MAAERLQTLAAIEAAVWHQLDAAAHDREHAWRSPVLATADGDGADARTVVLREVDAARRELVFYSDARSAKVAQLGARPQASALFWSRPLGWQLRVRLSIELETDGLAVTARWARVKLSPNAGDYLSAIAPGEPLQRSGATPPAAARAAFAVLTGRVRAIDWLELHPTGHRRAAFDAQGARWLQP